LTFAYKLKKDEIVHFSFSPVNTLESDESDEDFVRPNRRPATSKAQWEMWHKTTEQIYQLIQQQLNMHKNLRYGEFITEICLTTGMSTPILNLPMDLWNKLTDGDKDSYELQVS
jgi:hypothetical protein